MFCLPHMVEGAYIRVCTFLIFTIEGTEPMFNQQYFSYNVAVSFIGGGKQSNRRIPPTCRKSL